MGKIENDKLRQIRNDHFMRAFKYVAQRLDMNQGELAEAIGSKNAYISNYGKGTRPVPESTIDALVKISKENNIEIYKEYLLGYSDIMLKINVTEEEQMEVLQRKNNPDYLILQQNEKKNETPARDLPINIPDMSSVFNSALAKADETIASLKRELHTKDDLIQSLRDQLATKDQLIAEQKARLVEYRRLIDADKLSNHPFKMGVADTEHPSATK